MAIDLRTLLQRHLEFIREYDTEYLCRCPICGDSQKHKYGHGHFYVNKETGVYYCHRCNASGNIYSYLLKYANLDMYEKKEILQYMINNTSIISTNNKQIEQYNNKNIITDKLLNKNANKYLTNLDIFKKMNAYLLERLQNIDIEFIKQRLLFKLIYPFYSDTLQEYPSYNPSKLPNRLYIQHFNYVFSARKVPDIPDTPQFEYTGKYIFVKPKELKSIYPFVMYDCLPIYNIYIVEGVFDAIKLFYFLSFEEQNYIVFTTNGKQISSTLRLMLLDLFSQYAINKLVWIPDMDVEHNTILDSIEKLKSSIQNTFTQYFTIYIGRLSKYKDIGDMTDLSCLKDITLYKYEKFKLLPVINKVFGQ